MSRSRDSGGRVGEGFYWGLSPIGNHHIEGFDIVDMVNLVDYSSFVVVVAVNTVDVDAATISKPSIWWFPMGDNPQ